MDVQTGITALSNAKLRSSSYSQQDLVAPASESSNTKKKKKNPKINKYYFGNREPNLVCLHHLSVSNLLFFQSKIQVINSRCVVLKVLFMPIKLSRRSTTVV